MPKSGSLLLLRHGESVLNAEGRFTGLLDPPLTPRGRSEAVYAATLIAGSGVIPDLVFSSTLARSIQTAEIIARQLELDCAPVPVWELNERNYGSLTGRIKAELLSEHGPDVMHFWRRSLLGLPPPMDHEELGRLRHSSAMADVPAFSVRANESLCEVGHRVRDVWHRDLKKPLMAGRNVLVVGHGNSLRALCFVLDHLTGPELEELNLPTGQPLLYELDSHARPRIKGGTFLDPEQAQDALRKLVAEGGT